METHYLQVPYEKHPSYIRFEENREIPYFLWQP